MDPIMLLALFTALETVKMCVDKGASASDGLALTEKIVSSLLPKESKVEAKWCVWLKDCGDFKIGCIKVIRQHLYLPLKEAKDLVDKAPCIVLETSDKETAISMFNSFCNIKPFNDYEYQKPASVEVFAPNGTVYTSNC